MTSTGLLIANVLGVQGAGSFGVISPFDDGATIWEDGELESATIIADLELEQELVKANRPRRLQLFSKRIEVEFAGPFLRNLHGITSA